MDASETFSSPNLQEEQEKEELSRHEQLMLSLPKHTGWGSIHLQLYQGFWYPTFALRSILYYQAHYKPLDLNLLLVTIPKSGTTWLKAIAFSLVYRHQYPVNALHPLTTHNPHDLVPFLDYIPTDSTSNKLPIVSSLPPPRLFASHLPFPSLPNTLQDSNCKIVYLCRDPRDTFISQWHFYNKFNDPKDESISMEGAFECFCEGVSLRGPFWDHVLGYWKASLEMPSKVLFLKYEDIKGNPESYFRRLAEFLDCPFSQKEGVVGMIVGMCSFDKLSTLEVNKNGKELYFGCENKNYFRRGVVGDWANHLTLDMSDRLLKIVEDNLQGSGLKF